MTDIQVFTNPDSKVLRDAYPKTIDYIGYWYILEYGEGIKIGSTNSPPARYGALWRNAQKYGSVFVGKLAVSKGHTNYRENECLLHSLFSERRIDGSELFNISFEQALQKLADVELEHRNDTELFEASADAFTDGVKSFVLGARKRTFYDDTNGVSVTVVTNLDGSISINAYDVAIGLGWSQNKNGCVYVRWDTLNAFCHELGFSQHVGKDTFIPESIFYRLAMKANNETANRFQKWIAYEVLPTIRKTGSYCLPGHEPHTEPQRAITTDDYIRVAAIVANCRNERLPYVLGLLKQGGFPSVEILPIPKDAERDISGECAKVINKAMNDYGFSLRHIGNLTGVQPVQIQRIRSGTSVPTIARSKIIVQAIESALSEIE